MFVRIKLNHPIYIYLVEYFGPDSLRFVKLLSIKSKYFHDSYFRNNLRIELLTSSFYIQDAEKSHTS